MATIGPIAAASAAIAVKKFAEFDDKMREVGAVSQAVGRQFDSLTAKAKELGANTSFTAVQVAGLMAELGRAGFAAPQIEKMTGAVLDLARATSTDASQAAGIMAASIRQFSLGAEDATNVADSLTVAANKSFNTVESLGEALSYAGPVAADFGMSLNETLAILGSLGNVGIQGSNAGTAIRRLLTITGAEADKLKGIFGVSFKDSAGNARPLVKVLAEVNEATKNLGTAVRAQKFNDAFGLLGITAASAISKTTASAEELFDELEKGQGTARRTAEEMDAGVGGSLRKMASAAEGAVIKLGEVASEGAGLDGVLKELTSTISRFNETLNNPIVTEFAGKVKSLAGSIKDSLASIANDPLLNRLWNDEIVPGKSLSDLATDASVGVFGKESLKMSKGKTSSKERASRRAERIAGLGAATVDIASLLSQQPNAQDILASITGKRFSQIQRPADQDWESFFANRKAEVKDPFQTFLDEETKVAKEMAENRRAAVKGFDLPDEFGFAEDRKRLFEDAMSASRGAQSTGAFFSAREAMLSGAAVSSPQKETAKGVGEIVKLMRETKVREDETAALMKKVFGGLTS